MVKQSHSQVSAKSFDGVRRPAPSKVTSSQNSAAPHGEELVSKYQKLARELRSTRQRIKEYKSQLDQRAVVTDEKLKRTHRRLKGTYQELKRTYTALREDRHSLASTNRELQEKLNQLALMGDIAHAARSTVSLKERIDVLVKSLTDRLKVERAMFFLRDASGLSLSYVGDHSMSQGSAGGLFSIPLGRNGGVFAASVREQKPYVIDGSLRGEASAPLLKRLGLKSGVIIPLKGKGRVVGVVVVDNVRSGKPISGKTLQALKLFASHAALAVENAQFYERLLAKNVQSEKELEMAYAVQKGFLPQDYPQHARVEIGAKSLPARTVGGDLYSFRKFRPSDEKFGVGIGDVSGKGVSAALLMSMTVSTLDSLSLFCKHPISPLFSAVNKALLEHLATDSEMFVTLFYGLFDFKQNLLTYGKAGHDSPLVCYRDGSCELLEARGTILGRFKECQIEEKRLPLEPGMRIVLYTDGITETMNRKHHQFGVDRLRELVRRSSPAGPSELIDYVFNQVKRFRASEPQCDDLTMVVVDVKD